MKYRKHLQDLTIPAFLLAMSSCMHMDAGPGGGTFSEVPAQALVIANGGTGEVQIIDPNTLTVVSKLAVMEGMKPHHFGSSPDGSKLLIAAISSDLSGGHGGAGGHGGGGAASTVVYQLDRAAKTLQNIFSIDATGHNAAYTRDGKSIVIGIAD